ncbi:hypothetical protein P170DRAFT_439361 [Aspergillus steynii IBT 23096]|uniref:Uncharacterized protein n=1 Tax=Aspergillus steynii IBT 23096 TaxID=1392250 RepID=A0A2I2FYB3_9EURO|nr:uncharacterized protein P170DRAFT_439361 [Aspergillus steynii IBT 23096]PLB45620.1 hypothetical protein P170DRAFT_439361 [Aspergillus steynii IBT 23096]
MSERSPRPSSSHLEPPRKSVELEDSGAQDSVASTSDDEHFSDASEGHHQSASHPASGRTSPVPLTRVEKVDENPSHGEIPGTPAFEKREQDAIPDEIEVIPEGSRSRSSSTAGHLPRSSTPGGSPVPRTVVEKVDVDQPSHGDIPGTAAYEQRKADAVPDVVIEASDADSKPSSSPDSNEQAPTDANASEMNVPETVLSRVDSLPSEDTTSASHAHQRRPSDALPDVTEVVADAPDPGSSPEIKNDHQSDDNQAQPLTDNGDQTTGDQAAADDFDDFAEEQDMGEDDDFGDFDDGFQEPSAEVTEDEFIEPTEIQPSQPPTPPSVPPLLDFDAFQSLSDLNAALNDPLDRLFPASKEVSSLPQVEPIQNSSAIFNSERSLSLWSQLVAPPPLQPQNWVKSRIRRLFLVSLGVPVDLDEILPASKQKKLVLPSINIGSDTGGSTTHSRSQSQNRKDGTVSGTASPRTSTQTSRQRTSRRREPTPPPELDLPAVHRLCTTTDAALEGLTDGELQGHVKELEDVTLRASSVLEYWLKRLDSLVSEKEAFEGVIENLVNHARRVRK